MRWQQLLQGNPRCPLPPGHSLLAKQGGCPQQDQGRDSWLLTRPTPGSSSQEEEQGPPLPPRAPIFLGSLSYWGLHVNFPALPWLRGFCSAGDSESGEEESNYRVFPLKPTSGETKAQSRS